MRQVGDKSEGGFGMTDIWLIIIVCGVVAIAVVLSVFTVSNEIQYCEKMNTYIDSNNGSGVFHSLITCEELEIDMERCDIRLECENRAGAECSCIDKYWRHTL